MDWTVPLTIALVVGGSIGAIMLQRWLLERTVRMTAEKDAELPPR